MGCSAPWEVDGAPSVEPDEQWSTGGGYIYKVYAWRCYKGQRTVVYQGCADMTGCDNPKIERAPCAASATPIERKLAKDEHRTLGKSERWPKVK